MNLLEAPWIPVRDALGRRRRIAPHQIVEDIEACPIVAVDSGRPDFDGSLTQFLIALVQTAWTRAKHDWDRNQAIDHPPTPADLQALFAPLAQAFELDGDGPRFMQDRTLGAADKPAENDIAALLIESPGEQALERNTDHFVKRARVHAICPACAATALFALMTNAPGGGAGHRTSLRGGGPLTTLVLYDPQTNTDSPRALWRDIACNVLEPDRFLTHGDAGKTALKYSFPWLAPQSELQPRDELQPADAHPAQMYWAMPRRIRLDFEATVSGVCDLCGRHDDRLLTRYIAKNYGLNYKGPWRHPLSPYYRSKPAEPYLPMHPQPDGLGYRHWLGWVLGMPGEGRRVEPATVLNAFLASRTSSEFRLWAFGYDMDNMKARCWYDAVFPLFALPPDDRDAVEALQGILAQQLDAAEVTARFLRLAVRDAWFGDGEARGDLSFIDAQFWSETETAFFDGARQAVKLVMNDANRAAEDSAALKQAWLKGLRRAARGLFDRHAASGIVQASNPARLASAKQTLERHLGETLEVALGLKPPESKPARRRKA